MAQKEEILGETNVDPVAIASRYQTFIKGAVSSVYRLTAGSLQMDPGEAFLDADVPNAVFCYVYDETGASYGVTVELSEDGSPVRYRCQKIE
ncbi:MAG: hypothetical protein WCX95_04025 [Candidatus Gracilibacteria bacterium]